MFLSLYVSTPFRSRLARAHGLETEYAFTLRIALPDNFFVVFFLCLPSRFRVRALHLRSSAVDESIDRLTSLLKSHHIPCDASALSKERLEKAVELAELQRDAREAKTLQAALEDVADAEESDENSHSHSSSSSAAAARPQPRPSASSLHSEDGDESGDEDDDFVASDDEAQGTSSVSRRPHSSRRRRRVDYRKIEHRFDHLADGEEEEEEDSDQPESDNSEQKLAAAEETSDH